MTGTKSNTSALKHLQQQQRLLRIEYDYEKAEFQRQTATMGIGRKVKRGMAWHPVSVGRSYYNSLNQLVVEVTRQSDTDIEHSFEFNRQVVFFRVSADGAVSYFNFTATVCYADEQRMVVAMPSAGAVQQIAAAEMLGLQLYFDETSYRAMFSALDAVIAAKGTRLAQLRDLMLTPRPVVAPDRDLPTIELPWLNPSQQHAVNKVMRSRDVAVVHGPPGTGKTTTLVEAIYETLRREPQVLVCAQSNMAVDWISEKLVDRGLNVLRIGNPSRVTDKMLSFTYERRFEAHQSYPELWALRKEMRTLRSQGRRGSYQDRESLRNRLSRLRQRAETLEIAINADLFNQAHVVASTLVSADHRLMQGHHFGTLFIDEAAQALEAACWIAIRHAERVVFAGDHHQLPPTIKSNEALRQGLGTTLMETVVANRPETVTMLDTQYRMSRRIMQFPSRWFYGSRLKAAPEVENRGLLDLDTALEWIDTADHPVDARQYDEEFVGDSFGRINLGEAALTLEWLEAYIARIGLQRILDERIDFGIISPYKAQVQQLRRMVKASSTLRPLKSLISVNTIDGFQGQERDVIVISMVRSNPAGDIGFLRELRRMNVAITRARLKLVIVGNADTLTRHKFYDTLKNTIDNTDG